MHDTPASTSAAASGDDRVPAFDGAAARDEARRGDRAALTDRLLGLGEAVAGLDPSGAVTTSFDALWPLAEAIVHDASPTGHSPDVSVDTIAIDLVRRTGRRVGLVDLERWRARGSAALSRAEDPIADIVTRGAQSRRALLDAGVRSADDLAAELDRVYDELAAAVAARDEAEERAMRLAGARELADRLAAELHRDEWIRARVRKVKGTPVARAAIKARRAALGRG